MHKLFFATACLLATARVYAASPVQCAKGLKMFVSRGTGEEMGLGVLGNITKVIRERIPGSDDEAITYPASSVDPNYMISVGNGTLLLKEALTEYAQACPESKIAVLGYSQGAQIVSNSFCGTLPFWTITDMDNINMEDIMKREPPLSKEVTKNVISVVLFGDTTRAARPSYNYGTWNNTGNGLFYRDDVTPYVELGKRVRSYCDAGDPFCDAGYYLNVNAHLEYVQKYGDEVIDYVVQQYSSHRV